MSDVQTTTDNGETATPLEETTAAPSIFDPTDAPIDSESGLKMVAGWGASTNDRVLRFCDKCTWSGVTNIQGLKMHKNRTHNGSHDHITRKPRAKVKQTCAICGEVFADAAGLKRHTTRKHPSAAVSAKRGPGRPPGSKNRATTSRPPQRSTVGDRTPEEMFALVGKMTQLMFPEIPHARVLEIAEWQRTTMELLARG